MPIPIIELKGVAVLAFIERDGVRITGTRPGLITDQRHGIG